MSQDKIAMTKSLREFCKSEFGIIPGLADCKQFIEAVIKTAKQDETQSKLNNLVSDMLAQGMTQDQVQEAVKRSFFRDKMITSGKVAKG